jgi:hypothetical protein
VFQIVVVAGYAFVLIVVCTITITIVIIMAIAHSVHQSSGEVTTPGVRYQQLTSDVTGVKEETKAVDEDCATIQNSHSFI